MDTRDRPIRGKIISLVVAPIAALLALWIFATTMAAGPALNLLNVQTLLDTIGKPGEYLTAELQQERRLTAIYLAGKGDGAELGAQRTRTDQVIADFRSAAGSDAARDAAVNELDTKIDAMFTALDGIGAARGRIDRREVDVTTALAFYTEVVDVSFRMFFGSATFNDPQVDRGIRAITTLGRGREWLSQTDAQLAAAFTARKLSEADHARLIGFINTQRFLYAEAAADLSFEDRAAYEKVVGDGPFTRLVAMQDAIVASTARPGAVPVDQQAWQTAFTDAVAQLREVELAAAGRLDDLAAPIAAGILIRLGLAGLVGLAAVIVSVVVAVRVGRSLVGRLTRLRADALHLAGHRLPAVVRRLQGGEKVDVDAEAPPLEYGKDEIGQVGHAFSEVQRTAVLSAIQEAEVRRGINEVFLNIARRSQALLHRQLALLDKMERRAADPQELEDLYRVDHLATRMRRHAEDLVILAGATPGRGWRNPVPVIDVIRGAISEVEDYRRIDVTAVEHAAVVGRAVGDVIHLLAELLENAASFSPPNTRVHVAGQSLPNGYAVEIEDRGLGMTAEAIDEANARLLEPPVFDPAHSARLGLYVVARLGAKHGVHVQLRRSPYGGVTAVALLPTVLIGTAPGTALPAGPPPRQIDGPPPIPAQRRPADPPLPADPISPPHPISPHPISVPDPISRPHPISPPHPTSLPDSINLLDRISGTDAFGAADPLDGAAPISPARLGPDGLVRRRRSAESPAVPGPRVNGTDGLARRSRPTPQPPTGHGAPRPARDGAEDDGLPRRVRQTHIMPGLREQPADLPPAPPRSPEQARSLMSALQSGTAEGRRAAHDPPVPTVTPPPAVVPVASPSPATSPPVATSFGEAAGLGGEWAAQPITVPVGEVPRPVPGDGPAADTPPRTDDTADPSATAPAVSPDQVRTIPHDGSPAHAGRSPAGSELGAKPIDPPGPPTGPNQGGFDLPRPDPGSGAGGFDLRRPDPGSGGGGFDLRRPDPGRSAGRLDLAPPAAANPDLSQPDTGSSAEQLGSSRPGVGDLAADDVDLSSWAAASGDADLSSSAAASGEVATDLPSSPGGAGGIPTGWSSPDAASLADHASAGATVRASFEDFRPGGEAIAPPAVIDRAEGPGTSMKADGEVADGAVGLSVGDHPWAGPEVRGSRWSDGAVPEIGWAEAVTAPYPVTSLTFAATQSTADRPGDRAVPAPGDDPINGSAERAAVATENGATDGRHDRAIHDSAAANSVATDHTVDHAGGRVAVGDRVASDRPVGGRTFDHIAADHIADQTATVVHHGEVLPRATAMPGRGPASGDEDA
jgi:hypothetical protein